MNKKAGVGEEPVYAPVSSYSITVNEKDGFLYVNYSENHKKTLSIKVEGTIDSKADLMKVVKRVIYESVG